MPFKSREKKRANDRYWIAKHGYVQMNVWVPGELRDTVNRISQANGWTRADFIRASVELMDSELASTEPLESKPVTEKEGFEPSFPAKSDGNRLGFPSAPRRHDA